MVLQMFAVFDSKAGAYLQPWFSQTRGTAIRAFAGAGADASSDFAKFPEDFSLFHIGEFDQAEGKVIPARAPECLGTAATLKGIV